jgi:hypothetical protein
MDSPNSADEGKLIGLTQTSEEGVSHDYCKWSQTYTEIVHPGNSVGMLWRSFN